MLRLIFLIVAAASFVACGESHRDAERRDARRSVKVHAKAKEIGHETSGVFHRIGGHLQKFFTGRDTLSR
jgi:hypothetical protein